MSFTTAKVSPSTTASVPQAAPDISDNMSFAADEETRTDNTPEYREDFATEEPYEIASNIKSLDDTPKILYRVDYRNQDGKTILIREGADFVGLLPPKPDKAPVFEILTVVHATVSESRGDTAETVNREPDTSGVDTKERKSKGTLPEGFKNSIQSRAELIIRSTKLLNALRASVEYYPSITLLDEVFSLYEPWCFLLHHRAALQAYKTQHPEWHNEEYRRKCNADIDTLVDFLDTKYGEMIRDEEKRWSRSPPVCTFKNLWLLLKPGESCYYRQETGKLEPQITKRLLRSSKSHTTYAVIAWNIDFDGDEIGEAATTFYIAPFDGEKEIAALDYFPTKFFVEPPKDKQVHGGLSMQQRLIARGRKFWELAKKSSYMEYDGKALTYPHKAVCTAHAHRLLSTQSLTV